MNLQALYRCYVGDALELLRQMPPNSFHCCVTSPPYYGLRDYGVDGQIGLENSLDEFIGRLVAVFREVRRVLRDDGTLWVNLGDSYANAAGDRSPEQCESSAVSASQFVAAPKQGRYARNKSLREDGIKPKDLLGAPWLLAFALRADGWYLRQEIIWHKTNPMPESVTDRPTKAHEQLFLLSKSSRYYYDKDAVKEPVAGTAHPRGAGLGPKAKQNSFGSKQNASFSAAVRGLVETRNRRSVWTVPTRGFSGAHFATFPPDLIEPCILAGSPAGGLVLDPFGGSGTTAGVAVAHGRRAVLCELNPEYARLVPGRVQGVFDKIMMSGQRSAS